MQSHEKITINLNKAIAADDGLTKLLFLIKALWESIPSDSEASQLCGALYEQTQASIDLVDKGKNSMLMLEKAIHLDNGGFIL